MTLIKDQEIKRDDGMYARIGTFFHKKLEDIKSARLKRGIDKKNKSTRALTNLILKHDSWPEIERDLINYKFKESKNE